MSLNGGDQLARGAKSATFQGSKSMAQMEWDLVFMAEAEFLETYGVTKQEYHIMGDSHE